MSTDQTQNTSFYFDPADYPVFQERIRAVSPTDPFAGFALERLVIDGEAVYSLPGVLGSLAPGVQQVLVVMDQTPMLRGPLSLKPLVVQVLSQAGYQVAALELEGDSFEVVHADFEQVERVRSRIQPGMIVLSLGSGVVTDVSKYACTLYDREHPDQTPIAWVAVATANSVPVYASSMANISLDGVKRTWSARLPNAIVCDLAVLRDCPPELNLGGVGDMAAMYIAAVDWFMAVTLGIYPDSPAAHAVLDDARRLLLENAREIGSGSLAGVELMAKILTLGGLAMSFASDSNPMSGYEHGLAHLLDMAAGYFRRPVRNHGSQVAVAGIYVLVGLERLLDTFDPAAVVVDQCYPDPVEMERRIRAVFAEIDPSGAMAGECWQDYRKKLVIWQGVRPAFARMLAEWPEVRLKMKSLILPAKDYVHLLHDAGHPLTFPEIGVKEAEARWAYRNAYTLRKRVSTADLLIVMGWLDEAWVDWVFSEARRLVGQAPRSG